MGKVPRREGEGREKGGGEGKGLAARRPETAEKKARHYFRLAAAEKTRLQVRPSPSGRDREDFGL